MNHWLYSDTNQYGLKWDIINLHTSSEACFRVKLAFSVVKPHMGYLVCYIYLFDLVCVYIYSTKTRLHLPLRNFLLVLCSLGPFFHIVASLVYYPSSQLRFFCINPCWKLTSFVDMTYSDLWHQNKHNF